MLNAGPVIKGAANQSYATDGASAAVFEQVCRSVDLPVQRFYLHSDLRGGATLGPILAQSLPMPVVDVGNALLAMHAPSGSGRLSRPGLDARGAAGLLRTIGRQILLQRWRKSLAERV